MTENILPEKIICYICGKEAPPATPLFSEMCADCLRMYRNATSPVTYTLGHPANQSYIREENHSAMEIWENHLRKHGFVKKWGRWRKVKEETISK